MSHHHPRTDASMPAPPDGGPPGRSPQPTPAEHAEFTEAVLRPRSTRGHPLADSPSFADLAGLPGEPAAQPGGGEHPRLARPTAGDLAGTANGRDNGSGQSQAAA